MPGIVLHGECKYGPFSSLDSHGFPLSAAQSMQHACKQGELVLFPKIRIRHLALVVKIGGTSCDGKRLSSPYRIQMAGSCEGKAQGVLLACIPRRQKPGLKLAGEPEVRERKLS
jgi:hypothetical protein